MDKTDLVKANFIITKYQLDAIRPYMPNVDDFLHSLLEFELELTDAIVAELDENYDSTPTSKMLQDIYDEIYIQNEEKQT